MLAIFLYSALVTVYSTTTPSPPKSDCVYPSLDHNPCQERVVNMVEFFLPCFALWRFGQTARGKLEREILERGWGEKENTGKTIGMMELAYPQKTYRR